MILKHGLLEISLATTRSLFFSLASGKILPRSRLPHFSLAAARSRFRFGVYTTGMLNALKACDACADMDQL